MSYFVQYVRTSGQRYHGLLYDMHMVCCEHITDSLHLYPLLLEICLLFPHDFVTISSEHIILRKENVMATLPGVFNATKKDGTAYFRASVTYHSRHISLGSFPDEETAHAAYLLAARLLFDKYHFASDTLHEIESYPELSLPLTFDKWVMLLNLRDHDMYCRNPIYLANRFFYYCLDPETLLKFDVDDLFFYMNHKIMRRGGHLFVADYGMQLSILSRYGIRNYAVAGRDYVFANNDPLDFRYANIEIINRYYGVFKGLRKGHDIYTVKIHLNGDVLVGRYRSEAEAAVAYNKAVDILKAQGIRKNFPENYIEGIDEVEYARYYNGARINRNLTRYATAYLAAEKAIH